MVIGYDTEMYPGVSVEPILSEMKKHMTPVWGEHFQIEKGNQPFVYCMDRFEKNFTGENLVSDVYVEKLQTIYVVEQFKC